jgi:hypothetical protein
MLMKTVTLSAFAGIAAVALAACAVRQPLDLAPAPNAKAVEGVGKGAVDTAGGVRVEARAGAWKWNPEDLAIKVTPFFVELENTGSSRVLVRYNNFSVTDASGKRHAAMPPYDLSGSVTESYTVQNPYYPYTGFTVAPYLRRYYPRMAFYDGTFAYDQTYYDPYLTSFRRIRLPTTDMVQRALPEGVLAPGGKISGFVYFEHVDATSSSLNFQFAMTEATTNQPLATAHIPFVIR